MYPSLFFMAFLLSMDGAYADLPRDKTLAPGKFTLVQLEATKHPIANYNMGLFAPPPPPGCNLYLHGGADGHTYGGGCNTNGCRELIAGPGVPDCQFREAQQGTWICECPGLENGMAKCYATAFDGPAGHIVAVFCKKNGCNNECSVYLYAPGNFYPCNCY